MAKVLTPVSELVALGVMTGNGKHTGVVILNMSGTPIDFIDSTDSADGAKVNRFTASYAEARWINGYIAVTAVQFAEYKAASGKAVLQVQTARRNGKAARK